VASRFDWGDGGVGGMGFDGAGYLTLGGGEMKGRGEGKGGVRCASRLCSRRCCSIGA